MENQGMTVREVVEQIINDLGAIEVRMIDMERYGFPIARAINGLKEVCKAWDMQEAQEKAKDGDNGIQIVGKPVLVSEDEVPDDVKAELASVSGNTETIEG